MANKDFILPTSATFVADATDLPVSASATFYESETAVDGAEVSGLDNGQTDVYPDLTRTNFDDSGGAGLNGILCSPGVYQFWIDARMGDGSNGAGSAGTAQLAIAVKSTYATADVTPTAAYLTPVLPFPALASGVKGTLAASDIVFSTTGFLVITADEAESLVQLIGRTATGTGCALKWGRLVLTRLADSDKGVTRP